MKSKPSGKEGIKKKPLIVNLFGAPGAGKSTGAAYIFSKLKLMGFNVELATEYAKDKVYEETKEVFKNQVYIFGKQYFRITRLEDKVDIIVTDAPIPAALYYNDKESIEDILKDLTMTIFEEYNNLSFFVNRVKDYNPSGRLQDEEGSNQIGKELKDFLNELDISFEEIDGNIEGYDKIIWKIKDMYEVRLREWY